MLLQLSGVTLKRGITILNNIHWAMESGQNWVVLGSNGSGKTSLLNVLLGFEQPTSGRFMLLGKPFGTTPWHDIRKQVGVVSMTLSQRIQADQLAQNVVIAGKQAQLNTWTSVLEKELDEARRWLYLVGIEHLAERPWGVLSQGERQRLMIARALIAQPKLLILDEPCAGLDPVARETFLDFMQDTLTAEFRIPTVLITHHVEEIMPMFTHVLLMKSGQVLDRGSKTQVLTSQKLSNTFGANVTLRNHHHRYTLEFPFTRSDSSTSSTHSPSSDPGSGRPLNA